MKFTMLVQASILAMCSLSCAQDQPSAQPSIVRGSSNLQLVSKLKTPLVGSLVGKARCDSAGNLYIRFMDAAMYGQHHAITKIPIKQIKPNGDLGATFRITDASPEMSGKDLFVSPNGIVYQTGYTPDGSIYVVQFASDGTVRSKTRMAVGFFIPYQIAVFKSGEFLLSGTQDSDSRTPFTAVFGSDGALIRKIYEPEDEDSRQKALAGDPDFVPDGTNAGNAFVWHGDAVTGSDGNVYLLRATSPALIYVISPKGDVIRKLHVPGPSGLIAMTLRSGDGTLAVSFHEGYSARGIIELVDLQGNPLASYGSEDGNTSPGLSGCYLSGGFTFLKNDANHNVHVHRAALK